MTDDELVDALRDLVGKAARENVDDLVAEAVAAARSEAFEVIKRLARRALLDEAVHALDTGPPATRDALGAASAASAAPVSDDTGALPGHPDAASTGAGEAGTIRYVYGVTTEPVLDGPRAIGDDGAYALVADLPASVVEDWETHLEDPAWLEVRVRHHDQVLRGLHERTATVPFRFGAVFSSDAAVRDMLDQRGQELRSELADISGASEWGLRIVTDPDAALGAPAPPDRSDAGSDGERWISEHRSKDAARDELTALVDRAVDEAWTQLSDLARTSLERRPRPVSEGGQPGAVFEAAFLVPDERTEQFVAAATAIGDAHADEGVTLELSGPWPCYSFVGGGHD